MKNNNTTAFKIAQTWVGDGRPVFIVMEVAQAHDGSLGMAHAFIDLAAECGADAVKFQTHIAAAESTAREPFRVKFSRQDATRYDYWRRMEFTADQWVGLAAHAKEKGLLFLSTPFSLEALAVLQQLKIPAWKIGSGELANTPLLEAMLATRKPILLSSGMASWPELDELVRRIQNAASPLMVYQCTSRYPAQPGEVGLNVIPEMRQRFKVPVGLSDHSGQVCFGIAAAALGAASVEVHMTMSRHCFGPDVPASLEPPQLKQLVAGIRAVEQDLRRRINKDTVARSMREMRGIFGRSIVARQPLPAGTILRPEHLAFKKPGDGLPPDAAGALLGCTLKQDLQTDDLILVKHLKK